MKIIERGKYLESFEKFYLCDTGIRYAILGSSIRKKLTLWNKKTARKYISRSVIIYLTGKHLKENVLRCYRSGMLI